MIAPVLDGLANKADASKIEFYKVEVSADAPIAQRAGITAVRLFLPLLSQSLIGFTPPPLIYVDAHFQGVQLQEPRSRV